MCPFPVREVPQFPVPSGTERHRAYIFSRSTSTLSVQHRSTPKLAVCSVTPLPPAHWGHSTAPPPATLFPFGERMREIARDGLKKQAPTTAATDRTGLARWPHPKPKRTVSRLPTLTPGCAPPKPWDLPPTGREEGTGGVPLLRSPPSLPALALGSALGRGPGARSEHRGCVC